MLTEIITIGLGVLVGVALIVALAAVWNFVSIARAKRFIERHEREQAAEMERRGYTWFMGGWVKRR